MKQSILKGCAALWLAAFVCACSSNTYQFNLEGEGALVMGTAADYPPYELIAVDENGRKAVLGVDIEIGKAIAKRLGKNLTVVDQRFSEVLANVYHGRVDIALSGITPTKEREAIVDFSNPYYTIDNVILIRKEDADRFRSEDDLAVSARAGVQSGSVQEDLARKYSPNAEFYSMPRVDDLAAALAMKTLDFVYTERPIAEAYIKESDNDFAIAFVLDVDAKYSGYAVAVRKGDTALMEAVNETIYALKNDGAIDRWVETFTEE